jgi:hypothetical protein
MASKMQFRLLAFGILGLLTGVAIGYALRPIPPSPELTLYGGNSDATDIEPQFGVSFAAELDQQQQLEKLTTLVSRYHFCTLPIEVVALEDEVATINLAEHDWNQDPENPVTFPGCFGRSWRTNYFQGSAGGMITSKILAYTLLQPEFQGEWIEGVTFQYQGEPIEAGDWDHISLFGVITRDDLEARF